MPKCVACPRYATHEAKNHPMCKHHASLMNDHAKRVLPDKQIPYCISCGKPLNVIDWNRDRFMFVCDQSGCILSLSPQGGEDKYTSAMPSRKVRGEVNIH